MSSPPKGKKLAISKKPKMLAKKKGAPPKIGSKKKSPVKKIGSSAAPAPPPAKPVSQTSMAPVAPAVKKEGQSTQEVHQSASGSYGRPIPQAAMSPPAPQFSPPMEGQRSPQPRHIGSLREQTRQQPVPQGRSETEDLQEQVGLYWEVCDSLLGGAKLESIADLLHLLVCSLNLDVVSLVMLDPDDLKKLKVVASRGYNTSPSASVVACWEEALKKGTLDWSKLMRMAEGKDNDLAYWVVYEDLHSVGYVPIRDSSRIYGFLFVGGHDKDKKPSPLASNLLDACGSRIGLAQAETLVVQGDGQKSEKTSAVQNMIPDQLSRLKRALEELKRLDTRFQKDLASVAYECDKAIVEMEQGLDTIEGGRG